MTGNSIKLFYSYSHQDSAYKADMEKHLTLLRQSGLKEWSDRKILAGQKISGKILEELHDADIIVFLVSIDFLDSEACRLEWTTANDIANENNKRLISIILRQCPWKDFSTMGENLVLPYDAKPITDWPDKDSAWCNVYEEIKKVVEDIRETFSAKDDFKKKIATMEFCSQANDQMLLNDIFVFPNLIKPQDTLGQEISLNNINDILKTKFNVIQGDLQSGKTTLCNYIFLELELQKKPVLLVDLNEITNKKPSIEIFQKIYYDQFIGDFKLWVKQKNKTIIFDNLSHLGNSLDHILLAKEVFENILITTLTEEFDSYFIDDTRLLNSTLMSIKPFTHVKQEKLIKKWMQQKNKDQSEQLNYGKIDQIENSINSIIINNKILPRYPFFILSILQTHEAFMPQDLKITAYGHCYYALIIAHLIKSGIAKEDHSINSCLNFASHLAFEIHTKNPETLTISENEFIKFIADYKKLFIIQDSIINRLQNLFGIIKSCNGNGHKFTLAYSYYYFLGQYLAKNHKKNKVIISKLIETSHKKSNSLTIIFTIHHSNDLEIIDEILTHTMCAHDNINPAKLDKDEIKIFEDLLSVIPQKIISKNTVEEERDSERNFRDANETDVKNNIESSNDFINQTFQCYKNIEILSQILKNKFGTLEREKVIEIVEIICNAGLRLSGILLSKDFNIEELVSYIQRAYKESDRFDEKKPKQVQLNEIRKIVIFRVFLWVIINIERAVSAINIPEIKEIIILLKNKINTPAYDLIYYFYTLDTSEKFDDSDKELLKNLLIKYEEKNMEFLQRIISIRTQHYINTHEIRAPMKQAVSSLLHIEYKP